MWNRPLSRRGLAAFTLSAAVFLGSCEDDPIEGGDEEPEVGGFIITSGTTELYSYTDATAGDPDTLQLSSGTAYPIMIQWLDDDGDETTLEAGLSLEIEFGSAGAATFTPIGEQGGTLTAAVTGATPIIGTMRVRLFHEEEGHYDFTSVFFPVQVSP